MRWSGTLILAGMCAWPLWAEDSIYHGEGREHPFMALDAPSEPHTPPVPEWSIEGFALVGTLGRGDLYDALILSPEGLVGRFSRGDQLVGARAVLVEVTPTAARLESAHGAFTLALKMSEEPPK